MHHDNPIARLFSILFVIVLVLSAAWLQKVQAAGVLYAKPSASGKGDCSSWANACTLQNALAAASSGDEIWAAAGTYTPTMGADRTAAFQLKNGVAIYGGFAGTETMRSDRNPAANLTILSGDLNGDDSGLNNNTENVYHVVTGSGTDASAILDGFTIRGGNANGSSPYDVGGGMYNNAGSPTLNSLTFSGNFANNGGGMYNASSSPTLTGGTFSGNTASGDGGGMYNYSGSNPDLTNVTFTNNSAPYGGGMVNDSSSPTLTGGAFNNNTATANGGGMLNGGSGSSPTLTNLNFSSNTATGIGGGMYNSSSSPMLSGGTFSGNSATSGGGMYNSSSNPILSNVNFTTNTATYGGGVENDSSSPTFAGGTINGNTASDQGGGMYNSGDSPTLTNITFSNNTAFVGGGIYNSSSNPTLTMITFNSNTAGTEGGGIFDLFSSPVLTNVTFYGNSAGNSGGGMYNTGSPQFTNVTLSDNSSSNGGGIYNYAGSPYIVNTIFWNNAATNQGAQIFISGGGDTLNTSVVQNGCPSGSTCTNIITADPLLGTLGDFGGYTQTIPLQAGSSAIDTGDDSVCPATDQRGVTRPQGAHCDIGAYEYGGTPPTGTPTITPTRTITPTSTPTFTPTSNNTPTATSTNTPTYANTPTSTPSSTPPPNDDFDSATIINTVPYSTSEDVTGATSAADDPLVGCTSINYAWHHSVWFRFTPPSAGSLSANTHGSNYDTVLVVWTGTRGNLTSVACNDDTDDEDITSSLSANVNSGTIYYIEVASFSTVSGMLQFELNFTSTATSTPSLTPTFTLTSTPTRTSTPIYTPTSTPTRTSSPTLPLTPTRTSTPSATGTFTPTETDTIAPTHAPSNTPTATLTATFTPTSTPTPTMSPTNPSTPTRTPTFTPMPGKPGVPALLAPANNALLFTFQPTLDWKDAKYADHYELQFGTDKTFATNQLDQSDIKDSGFTFPTDLTRNRKYYWRVRTYNSNGNASKWSTVRSFRIALPPPDKLKVDNTIQNLRPTFTWDLHAYNPPPYPTGYTIQISKTADFTKLVKSATTGTLQKYTLTSDLPPNTKLYWRIRTNGVNGPSDWALPADPFFTTGNPPSVPSLLKPANNASIATAALVLDWSDSSVPGGAFPFHHYLLQVDDNSDFSSPVINLPIAPASASRYIPVPVLTTGIKFYWRVQACNTKAECSDWSKVRTFKTK